MKELNQEVYQSLMDIASSEEDIKHALSHHEQYQEFVATLKAYQEYLAIQNPVLASQLMTAMQLISTSQDFHHSATQMQSVNVNTQNSAPQNTGNLHTDETSNSTPMGVFSSQNTCGNMSLDQNGIKIINYNGNLLANQNLNVPITGNSTNVSNMIYPGAYQNLPIVQQQQIVPSLLISNASPQEQQTNMQSTQISLSGNQTGIPSYTCLLYTSPSPRDS